MSLEQQISQMPKILVAIIVISLVVIFLFVFNPPHTICDTQAESISSNLGGVLFPVKVKKNVNPARIHQAKANCRQGNSSGACYEYFNSLRTVIDQVDVASPDCRAQVTDIREIHAALRDGAEDMALLAWGHQPPATSAQRFGWMQESELALFCRLKDIYSKAKGEDAWNSLRLEINKKFPGELPVGAAIETERPKAIQKMNEQELWTKSIFSIRCESVH